MKMDVIKPEEMKRTIGILIMLTITALLTLSSAVPALALDLPDPGILPNSPLYTVKRGWERALDVITYDPESNAQLHYQYALTRLAEADALADMNQTEYIDDVVEDYEEEMNITEQYIETNTNSTDGNVTSDDANTTNQGIGQIKKPLIELVNDTRMKHLIVLELVSQKVPEHAAMVIQRNINRTLERKFSNSTMREQAREKIHNKEKVSNGPKSDKGSNGKGPKDENGPETGSDQGNGQGNGSGTGKPSNDKENKGKSDKGNNEKGKSSSSNKGGGGGKGKK